jgi:hypothetical protein
MGDIKKFERFSLEEGPEKSNQKWVTSDRPKIAPAPLAARRQPQGVYDGLERELKDLLNGYTIFLTRDEIIEIVNKVIKKEV